MSALACPKGQGSKLSRSQFLELCSPLCESAPVFAYADFLGDVGASHQELGVVLSQNGEEGRRPIACACRGDGSVVIIKEYGDMLRILPPNKKRRWIEQLPEMLSYNTTQNAFTSYTPYFFMLRQSPLVQCVIRTVLTFMCEC